MGDRPAMDPERAECQDRVAKGLSLVLACHGCKMLFKELNLRLLENRIPDHLEWARVCRAGKLGGRRTGMGVAWLWLRRWW